MRLALRIYTIRPGKLDEWLAEWREQVVPLRRAAGFKVLGAWTTEETAEEPATFTWLLGYDEPGSLEAANATSYHSPERQALEPDPARHIAEARQLSVRAVDAG